MGLDNPSRSQPFPECDHHHVHLSTADAVLVNAIAMLQYAITFDMKAMHKTTSLSRYSQPVPISSHALTNVWHQIKYHCTYTRHSFSTSLMARTSQHEAVLRIYFLSHTKHSIELIDAQRKSLPASLNSSVDLPLHNSAADHKSEKLCCTCTVHRQQVDTSNWQQAGHVCV